LATARAVLQLSPVTITGMTPIFRRPSITTAASLLSGSAIPKAPVNTSSYATSIPVFALSSSSTTKFSTSVEISMPFSSSSFRLPTCSNNQNGF